MNAADRVKIDRIRRWVLGSDPAKMADPTVARFRLDAEVLLEALTEAELDRDLARAELEHRHQAGAPPRPHVPGSTSPRPDWTLVAGGAQRLRTIVEALGPEYVAVIDANQAWLRDAFDAVGLTIADERTLYVAIVAHSLLLGMIENAVRSGRADVRTLHDAAVVTQTFVASVYEYLPAEAKR